MPDNFDLLVTDAVLTSLWPDIMIVGLCPTYDIRGHFTLMSFLARLCLRLCPSVTHFTAYVLG